MQTLARLGMVSLLALSACESVPSFSGSGSLGAEDEDNKKDPDGGIDNITGLGGSGAGPSGGDGDGDVTNTDVCGNGELEDSELCDDGNDEGGDGCSSDCSEVDPNYVCINAGEDCVRVVTCGNGVLEGDEACDDGNTEADDGCAAACDEVDPAFSCDKPGVPCVALPVCGNGVRERGEQCDDAEATPDDGDGCSATCQQEPDFFCSPGKACVALVCGDGNRTPNEECDDGDLDDDDGCSSSCTVEDNWTCTKSGCFAQCGSGTIEGNEECDDGELVSGDGCSAACKVEPYYSCSGEGDATVCTSSIVCGNGTVDPGEVCDPAASGQSACYNTIDNPAQACQGFNKDLVDPPVCGNGVVEIDEECDGGVGCDSCEILDGYACPGANYCFLLPACGDGIVQSGEQCDPGAMSAFGCNTCMIETDFYCSGQPSTCVQSICGDGLLAPDEACDDGPGTEMSPGTPVSGDGCSATCQVESGFVCPPSSSCQPRCGNGTTEPGEQCDEDTPGCVNCILTPGYHCAGGYTIPGDMTSPWREGINCGETVCGDGANESGEGCDDGNLIAGDGCGPTCQVEPPVTVGPSPVVAVTCGDGLKTGSEQCDDGNTANGDGCSSACSVETGWYCDPNVEYPDDIEFKITYRDFKQRNDTGGHPHMKQSGVSPPNTGRDLGIVGELCDTSNTGSCGRLSALGKPVYAGGSNNKTIDNGSDIFTEAEHASYFELWYTDSTSTSLLDASSSQAVSLCKNPGLGTNCSNTTTEDTVTLDRVGTTSAYRFDSNGNNFYPLGRADNTSDYPLRGWGYTDWNSGDSRRNFHFTSELRYFFQYQGRETLTFYGDDDVWVFINGRLAVDIGGIHAQEYGRVVLGDDGHDVNGDPSGSDSDCTQSGGGTADALNGCLTDAEVDGDTNPDERFNLVKGGVYEIVVFQAERQPSGSNYQLTLDGFIAPRSSCYTDCGDNIRAGSELCDDGSGMPSSGYGVCLQECTFEFCGDGETNGTEACDNGTNGDTYDTGDSEACAPGCVEPGECGDGIVQSAFEVCDDGVNDGSYGGCESDCQSVAGYCGDGVPDSPDEDCDTPGSFTNYRKASGACGYDCKDAGFCGDNVRNGDELCDDGVDNGTASSNCNDDCEFEPYCGDGLKTSMEQCDYGGFAYVGEPEDAPYGGCTDMCELGPRCGDGTAQLTDGEECDDGDANVDGEYGKCTTACFNGPSCGDAVLQSIFGEACDNGFNEDEYAYKGAANPCGPGCTTVPSCGDGVLEPSFELCDDGADNDDDAYDGCTTECVWGPYCGDGVQNGTEECDLANGNVPYSPDGEGCSLECTNNVPSCGDGVRNGPEQCDLGEGNNTGEYGGCKADCTRAPRCGDGVVDEGEACDAGASGSLLCTAVCSLRDVVK